MSEESVACNDLCKAHGKNGWCAVGHKARDDPLGIKCVRQKLAQEERTVGLITMAVWVKGALQAGRERSVDLMLRGPWADLCSEIEEGHGCLRAGLAEIERQVAEESRVAAAAARGCRESHTCELCAP